MLILEGSDLVGKSILAKSLVTYGVGNIEAAAERLGIGDWLPEIWPVYRHLGLLPPHWDYHYDYTNIMERNIVQDRFFLSEMAYGEVCRGESKVTREMAKILDEELEMVGGVTLIITATEKVLTEQYKRKKDDLFSLDRILAVNQWFIKEANMRCHEEVDAYWAYHITSDNNFPKDNEFFIDKLMERWVYEINESL